MKYSKDQLLSYVGFGRTFLDLKIHHIIKVEYFLKMLACRSLYLRRVTEWDDPYDSAILKCPVTVNGMVMELSENVKSIYGQCWTARESECDGLWRVYSDNRKAATVRLTTTVRKLLEALLQSPAHDEKRRDFAIGKVEYREQSEIEENMIFRPIELGNAVGWGEEFLLLKRKEFSYEDEVRLIHFGKPEKEERVNCRKTGIYPVEMPWEWSKILSRVQFSPWMCTCLKDCLRKKLCEEFGFQKEQVVDSTLYEPVKKEISVELVSPEVKTWCQDAEAHNGEHPEETERYQEIMRDDQPGAEENPKVDLPDDEADDLLNQNGNPKA